MIVTLFSVIVVVGTFVSIVMYKKRHKPSTKFNEDHLYDVISMIDVPPQLPPLNAKVRTKNNIAYEAPRLNNSDENNLPDKNEIVSGNEIPSQHDDYEVMELSWPIASSETQTSESNPKQQVMEAACVEFTGPGVGQLDSAFYCNLDSGELHPCKLH